MNDARHIPILGSNGAPTKVKLGVEYQPGPLATPVVLPPISVDGQFLAPAFGGATRMETVAARILAGVLTPASFGECAHDPAYRRQLIHAAVVIAWELIGHASEFRGLPPEDAPSDECEVGTPGDQNPENPSKTAPDA